MNKLVELGILEYRTGPYQTHAGLVGSEPPIDVPQMHRANEQISSVPTDSAVGRIDDSIV